MTKQEKLVEAFVKLQESADIHQFSIGEKGPITRYILEVTGLTLDEIKTIDGFLINDFEPVDYIVIKEDGTAVYVNTKYDKVKKYATPQEAYNDNLGY